MSENVQFDEDQIGMRRGPDGRPVSASFSSANANFSRPQSAAGGMGNWLVRHGIIANDSGAKVVLGAIVCINFIAAGLIIYYFVLR